MSENEKDIIKRLITSVSVLDKENQKYVLGVSDGLAIAKKEKDKKDDG